MRAVQWKLLNLDTRYYTTKLHQGAFCLPAYVENLLRSVEAVGGVSWLSGVG